MRGKRIGLMLIVMLMALGWMTAGAAAEEYTLEREAGTRQVTFYWDAAGADVASCDMWIWWEGADGRGYPFYPCSYGAKAMVNVPEQIQEVGFIVRRNCTDPGGTAWADAQKDYEADRYAKLTGDSTTIYLKSGDGALYQSEDGGKTLEPFGENQLATVQSGKINTDEALQALLAEYRKNNTRSFQISLEVGYFELLREASFGRFAPIALKAGLADYSLKYSYDGELYFEGVQWTEPRVAECATEREVRQAMDQFLEADTTAFQLIITDETAFSALKSNNHLYAFAALKGIEEIRLRYTLSAPYIFYVDQIRKCDIPWAPADSEESFLTAMEYMAQQGADHFYIAAEPGFFERLTGNQRSLQDRLETRSPMENWRSQNDSYYCRIGYQEVSFTTNPRFYCETEEEIVEAICQCGASGNADFNLILPEQLYKTVSENSFRRLHELEAEAGLSNCSMSYISSRCLLLYANAEIHSDAVKLTTGAEANAWLTSAVAEEKENIALFCTPELYRLLIGNISPFAIGGIGMSPIFDCVAQAGIFDYGISYSEAASLIEVRVSAYYPGTKILLALQKGTESSLSGREQETLQAARDMAAQCTDSDPLARAKALHDLLCERIVYTDDESTDEDDTAIGALLNGQANCDGYADAFYLVGSLAGLNVKYQHGDSYKLGLGDIFSNVTHMWNLLEVDGNWRLVDVTWDDQEGGTVYTWFNLGEDRARRMHIWNAETSETLLPVTDLSTRPENEYLVQSQADVKDAVQRMLGAGQRSAVFIFADGTEPNRFETISTLEGAMTGAFLYSWNERMMTMTVERQ